MIRFENPKLLYLLLILPVLILIFYMYMSWKRRALQRFGDYFLVTQLVPDLSMMRYKLKFFVFLFAMLLIILGMANPQIGSKLEEVKRKGVDLVIYNRWGQVLYTGKDGWDGTFNGNQVAAGTYYYIMTLNEEQGEPQTLTGVLTLISNTKK